MEKIEVNITTKDDISLNARIHEVGSPVWIIIIHGLGEHQKRHDYLFGLLGEDFNIISFDLRGHGVSSGTRASVEDFDSFNLDIDAVINFLKNEYKMNDFIIHGHSMGGLITANYIQQTKSSTPKAVFLSSPAIGTSGMASKIVNTLPKSLFEKAANLNKGIYLKGTLDLKKLSHHYLVYTNYIKDPLCSLKINTKLLFKIIDKGLKVKANAKPVEGCKIYGAIGSSDVLVGFESTVEFFKKINREKYLKVFKGAYHELHNEIPEYKDRYIEFLKETYMSLRYNESP